jgi:serine/threonine protein phosphatase PrpC
MTGDGQRGGTAQAHFRIGACTADHIGDRTEQQDRVAILSSPRNPGAILAVVADGIGGRSGGRLASDQVIATAESLFGELSAQDADPRRLLEQIAAEAHMVIRLTALSAEKEPHSTIAALLVRREHAAWAHAGDSRVYLFRSGRLLHRTEDHSYEAHLRADGKGTLGAAEASRFRNMLVSALGLASPPRLVVSTTEDLRVGDVFLLCSDGLWPYLSDDELASLLRALPPREAAEHLVRIARDRACGHGDNLALAIVKLEAPVEKKPFFDTRF